VPLGGRLTISRAGLTISRAGLTLSRAGLTLSRAGLALCLVVLCAAARADGALHSLWELHGKHNTVYLLGSIHVLRPSDYPLAPAVQQAYTNAKSLLMEVNLDDMNLQQLQAEMLASATLPVLSPMNWGSTSACSTNSRPGSPPRQYPSCS
jgi:hypothetical protein